MTQQSTTQPREVPKTQGKATRQQQKRILNKEERTDSPAIETTGETLEHSGKRNPTLRRSDEYIISSGDRSIQRGAHDRGDHDKSSN